MLKPPQDWQSRLFYIVVLLICYQMSILAIMNIGCTWRFIAQDAEPGHPHDKFCLSAGEDTKGAVEKYLTLVLALIAKMPPNHPTPTPSPRKKRIPSVKSTIDPKGTQDD